MVRVIRWLDCVGEGTTMVGLRWSRPLQWFGCGVRGTTTVACGGLDTTMVGLRW